MTRLSTIPGVDRLRPLLRRALNSSTVRGSSFLFVTNWLTAGISFIQSVILTRSLGVEGYGLLIAAISVITFIVSFLDLYTTEVLVKLMGSAVVRDAKQEAMTLFHIGLLADMALAVIAVLVTSLAVPLLLTLNDSSDPALLGPLMRLYILTIPFTTLQGTFIAVVLVYKQFGVYAWIGLINALVLIVATLLVLPFGLSAVMLAYLIAAIIGFCLTAAISIVLLSKNLRIWRGSQYRHALKLFLPFAFHTSVMASFKTVFSNADILLLFMFRPVAELSYYRIATSAVSLVTLPVSPVSTVIFPAINEAWTRRNLSEVRRLIRRFALYTGGVSLAGTLFFFAAARWLVVGIYGPGFLPAVVLIYILVLAYSIGNLQLWMRPAALSAGQPQLLTYITTFSSILRLAIAVPFVLWWGAVGVSVAFLIITIVGALASIFFVAPRLGLGRQQVGELPTV